MEKVVGVIKIEQLEGGAFSVVQGEKYSGTLSYDEMLGLVSALTIAKDPNCLYWMKTEEEHEVWHNSLKKSAEAISEVEFEDILVPENIGIYITDPSVIKSAYGDGLFIKFGNKQFLGVFEEEWIVNSPALVRDFIEPIQCKLIPCKREDLRVGDTAFADLSNDFEHSSSYCKIINEMVVAFITPLPSSIRVMAWSEPSLQWYKVVPQ